MQRHQPISYGSIPSSPIAWTVIALAIALFQVVAFANDASLVAHYPCDEGNGVALHDRSGNGNDGKLSGGMAWGRGASGAALHFDGKDGYVDCGARRGLNLGTKGSILFWFSPETTCQGGLVAWTKGTEESNQRLVVALNTYVADHSRGEETFRELGVYLSDGKNLFRPFQSNFRKAYFPPADRWLFLAVTLNGRSVDIYRDGVLVHTIFQALSPDSNDIPLWLGRCLGLGGASDYFRGLMSQVRIYNRPLTEQEVYGLYMKDAVGRGKDTTGFGSLGIKPTPNPRAGTVFADLDYRGLAPMREEVKIKAELLNRRGVAVRAGNVRLLPAWGHAEVVFDTHDLAAGLFTIRASASKGRPATTSVKWSGRAKGWEKIRVLNNFCWELLNVSPGAKPKDRYQFSNPRRGWVYIVTEAGGDTALSLPDAQPPSIHVAGKGTRQEAMRWLDQGEYTLSVSGQGALKRLMVRAVPTLSFGHYPHVGPDTGDDSAFLAKYVLPNMNTLITGGRYAYPSMNQTMEQWTREQGRQWLQIVYRPEAPTTTEGIENWIVNSIGMKDPEFQGLMMDEFDPGNDRMAWITSYYDEWTSAVTKVLSANQNRGRMVIPYFAYNMFDYQKSSEFLRRIVAGGSYLGNEVYLDEQENAGKSWVFINEVLADLAGEWEKAVPGSIENMVVVLSYLSREYWNPSADFNAYMDMQMEHLATRPEFFGLAGIEWYVSHHSHEDHIRYAAKLCRHYGLEGHTGRLSKDPYTLPHLRNGDFTEGAIGWILQAAEPEGIAVKRCTGYGYLQERRAHWPYTETSVLWTRRSDKKPNAFSQKIKDLEPGRLYVLRITTGDYQEFVRGTSAGKEHAVHINISDADLLTDWYRTKSFKNSTQMYQSWTTAGPFSGKNPYCMNIHHRIFRAKSKTATLIVSDWKSDTEPGGPIGEELMFNSISVAPYPEP
ncbi:MAG: LamG domain-containing protein [Armatimonadetes bacterium]|nr:LamG domain-containing protein [Armatimonadota bacterium]